MKPITSLLTVVVLLALARAAGAQTPPELVEYPELIVVNAKIVTVDDASFSQNPGSVVQAMAIRNRRILALGDNARIRGLAGPQTRIVDLKGRTVLPGLISTHEHTQEYAYTHE